jgi:hypothetical protein
MPFLSTKTLIFSLECFLPSFPMALVGSRTKTDIRPFHLNIKLSIISILLIATSGIITRTCSLF